MVPPPRSAPQIVPVTLRLARTFAAPPDKVFKAWTQPEALKRWSAQVCMQEPDRSRLGHALS
jgi:uncharacterized protein YndB with AHSA1/START domain